jgi:hypothetical protein
MDWSLIENDLETILDDYNPKRECTEDLISPPIKKALDCSFVGCYQRVRCKKLCQKHYHAMIAAKKKEIFCIYDGCTKQQRNGKLCYKHFNELYKEIICNSEGCKKVADMEGLCLDHYLKEHKKCSVSTCDSTLIFCKKKILCEYHYRQQNRKKKLNSQEEGEIQNIQNISIAGKKSKKIRICNLSKSKTIDLMENDIIKDI